jgi:hypothetical protein
MAFHKLVDGNTKLFESCARVKRDVRSFSENIQCIVNMMSATRPRVLNISNIVSSEVRRGLLAK